MLLRLITFLLTLLIVICGMPAPHIRLSVQRTPTVDISQTLSNFTLFSGSYRLRALFDLCLNTKGVSESYYSPVRRIISPTASVSNKDLTMGYFHYIIYIYIQKIT